MLDECACDQPFLNLFPHKAIYMTTEFCSQTDYFLVHGIIEANHGVNFVINMKLMIIGNHYLKIKTPTNWGN